jgi:hypothetical protein
MFSRESLPILLDRAYNNYISLFKPLDKTPRYNLLKVFASVDAGIYHQLLGDLGFLADQIFPDTATGEYLRLYWSDRVPPLYATAAVGTIQIPGVPGAAVPAGLVYASASGLRYFTESAYRVGEDGFAVATVKADASGAESNLLPGEEVSLISSIPVGLDSKALTVGNGIAGGTDGESDEVYLTRVLQTLRNTSRYGKPGDFADWAIDASPEVSKAWEFKNFGVFGALLIQVAGGNQIDGITRVDNLDMVRDHLNDVAPPVLFTVRTPELFPLSPAISLLPEEDYMTNRELVLERLKLFLQVTSAPGKKYTAGMLREAAIDGVSISGGIIKLAGSTTGEAATTILQLPVLGDVTWE